MVEALGDDVQALRSSRRVRTLGPWRPMNEAGDTTVYWIPLFELLSARGVEVRLVAPRQLTHVPGRKTDALDCQWIQPPTARPPSEPSTAHPRERPAWRGRRHRGRVCIARWLAGMLLLPGRAVTKRPGLRRGLREGGARARSGGGGYWTDAGIPVAHRAIPSSRSNRRYPNKNIPYDPDPADLNPVVSVGTPTVQGRGGLGVLRASATRRR